MRATSALVLVCAVLCGGCAPMPAATHIVMPESDASPVEPRGFVGETCPPALAAKAHC